MKNYLFLLKNCLCLLVATAIVAIATPAAFCADVFGPPSTIDYQGRLLDGAGAPLAPGTPANYEVQFRIYDEQTGGNIVWAEKQLATVSKGLFSVRLGEGDAILGVGAVEEGTVGHASPGLLGAFDGKERYLGVTVVIPGQTTPSEVTPRLAFLASPFSYVAARAQSADRVVQTASSQPSALSVGSVSYVPLILSATSTLGGDNANVLANATAGAVAASLPAGTAGEKKEITVTKTDASANPVTVVPPGGGLINGSATPISLTKRGDSVTLRNTDANNWIVVSRYSGEGTPVFANTPIAGGLLARGNSYLGFIGTGYAFNDDPDTGVFGVFDNRVGLRTNGSERMTLTDPNTWIYNNLIIQHSANNAVAAIFQDGRGSIGGSGFNDVALYVHRNLAAPVATNYSIYTEQNVAAPGYVTLSDARIKKVIGVSDNRKDLEQLMQIKVTDYTFLDTEMNGKGQQKKVIAQELEQVYPLAVSTTTNVVPDMMKKARMEDGWITLATDLKQGERVKIVVEGRQSEIVDVLEVKSNKFRTSFKASESAMVPPAGDSSKVSSVKPAEKKKPKEVLVYGREVPDFHMVDYNAVSMLNVSATQQIKKDSDAAEAALRAENEALRARLATLEGEKVATEKRLVALEVALLGKGASSASATNDASTTIPVTSK